MTGSQFLARSGHLDSFARDSLPPPDEWPEFLFGLPEPQYPERLNCVSELLDAWVVRGDGDRPCLHAEGETLTYAQLAERVNRVANVLIRDLGLVPGNRVLLRAPNAPLTVAIYLAIIKAGGIVVATMPLLRSRELVTIVRKAKIAFALCDGRYADEMEKTKAQAPDLRQVLYWRGAADAGLETLMRKPGYESFAARDTARDDVCVIAFTSGTTGEPKGTLHFHRDLLATCDSYGRHILQAAATDRFISSAPLGFTFGLGALVLFPMRIGASAIVVEKPGPENLLRAIEQFRATVCFTAPTGYRAMLPLLGAHDVRSLRICASGGEFLPASTFAAWEAATGLRIREGIGATEMTHNFIASPAAKLRAGVTGLAVPGYEARIVDERGDEVARGTVGRLAVRGPTGCRYLSDARQGTYVEKGWNVTGDAFLQDDEGYFHYQSRADDMIVSSGYNIAGPEIEEVLLQHPSVAECGVVGIADDERGQIVTAFVVLRAGSAGDAMLTQALQNHVKARLAPYKYPRAITYVEHLPRTATGKLQRAALRQPLKAP